MGRGCWVIHGKLFFRNSGKVEVKVTDSKICEIWSHAILIGSERVNGSEWVFSYFESSGTSPGCNRAVIFDFVLGVRSRDTKLAKCIIHFLGHGLSRADETSYVGSGRGVMHDGITLTQIQGQGSPEVHEGLSCQIWPHARSIGCDRINGSEWKLLYYQSTGLSPGRDGAGTFDFVLLEVDQLPTTIKRWLRYKVKVKVEVTRLKFTKCLFAKIDRLWQGQWNWFKISMLWLPI